MARLCGVLLALLIVALALPSSAMQFQLMQTTAGQRVILASGPIVPGDARKLSRVLMRATRDKNDIREILLDSPGGSIGEALTMADIMDAVGVSTVIPDHALCASACGSILFVSGRSRTIEPGGVLAIHSCYDARSGEQMDFCNRIISEHAQHEGVPANAMMALQEAAGPMLPSSPTPPLPPVSD